MLTLLIIKEVLVIDFEFTLYVFVNTNLQGSSKG